VRTQALPPNSDKNTPSPYFSRPAENKERDSWTQALTPTALVRELQRVLSGHITVPWNADLLGTTGGPWDVVYATNFRSTNPFWNSMLRGVNNTLGFCAGLVNILNNLGGVLLVHLPGLVDQGLQKTIGTDMNEVAWIAQSSLPIPLADLAFAGLAQASEWSAKLKLNLAPYALNLGEEGKAHILERHVTAWPKNLPKSLFLPETDLSALAEQAARTPVHKTQRNRLVWIIDAKRPVGMDREQAQLTSIYTVISDAYGNIRTMFPGRPTIKPPPL